MKPYLNKQFTPAIALTMALTLVNFLFSCEPQYKVIYPKGKYLQTPYIVESDKSKDQVWQNIIDFFGQKGIGIKIIDRSSGLITTDAYRMPFTYEDSKGNLVDKGAYLVISKIVSHGFNGATSTTLEPYYVTAEWNIIIKEENGKTLININIVNPKYSDISRTNEPFSTGGCLSTGVFEKTIADIIK